MKTQFIKFGLLFFAAIVRINSFSQTSITKVGETVVSENKKIDWEMFDSSSTVPFDKIKSEDLQGLWKAFKGIYKFNEITNAMELTEPVIIEINGDTYRRNSKNVFEKYHLQKNIISYTHMNSSVTGIINKITSAELIITWKSGENYTRYYYTK
jgi:hypothetical protein